MALFQQSGDVSRSNSLLVPMKIRAGSHKKHTHAIFYFYDGAHYITKRGIINKSVSFLNAGIGSFPNEFQTGSPFISFTIRP